MAKINRTKIERIKDGPRELLNSGRMKNIMQEAAAAGMNLTNYLEKRVDPTGDGWTGTDAQTDAFGRLMQASGITWRSEPDSGIWADTFGDIFANEDTRALLPEYGNRVWRSAKTNGYAPQVVQSRGWLMTEDDQALGTALRPYAQSAIALRKEMEPAFGIGELLAFTTPIEGTAYKRIYLDGGTDADMHYTPIGEAARIPRANITTSEKYVRINKYGKAIQLSYEALRNTPIDRIGLFIAQLALNNEEDRIEEALSVILNGDGTANTAATVVADSDLVTGATDLTFEVWLAFKASFRRPYHMTHVFARTAEGVKLQLLSHDASVSFYNGSESARAIGAGAIVRINEIYDGLVRLGETSGVPAKSLLGLDARYALGRLTEIGSEIAETVKFIENQTQLLTFTEVEGFEVVDAKAAKLLDFS